VRAIHRYVGSLIVLALVSSPPPMPAGATNPNCRPVSVPLPAIISEAGVYCLAGNVGTSMLQGIAILIQADNVVLDLNGFVLEGFADRARTTAIGVFAGGFGSPPQNVTVRNGTIRGFHYGVTLIVSNGTVESIRADRNTFVGITVGGVDTVIRNNQVVATGGTGIVVGIPGLSAAKGIQASGPAPRVLNNDVTGIPNEASAKATGIFLTALGGLVVNNRIVSVERGIEFFGAAGGKYRDNLTFDVVTPYTGGTDAGNNH
jgi:hypothetical protein